MDPLWFDEIRRKPFRLRTAKRFRAAGVVMLRGSWRDPDATYLGIKAGTNDACEHGHYDLGSFGLDCGGVRWATDLGPDDYNLPGYFTPEMRSRYYRTSTIGHNTIINGECQPPTACALITRQNLAGNTPFVVMDLSTAYPNAVSALRGFALIDGRHVLIVDEIVPNGCLSTVDWQMHTVAQIGLGGATATLIYPARNDAGEPSRFYVRTIDPGLGAWTLGSAASSEPQGQTPNTGAAKLVLRLEEVAKPVRLAVFLSPDAGACASVELPLASRPLSDWA